MSMRKSYMSCDRLLVDGGWSVARRGVCFPWSDVKNTAAVFAARLYATSTAAGFTAFVISLTGMHTSTWRSNFGVYIMQAHPMAMARKPIGRGTYSGSVR